MRFNFWQWLGVALLLIGLAVILWRENRPAAPQSTTPTSTTPAPTPPTTVPAH